MSNLTRGAQDQSCVRCNAIGTTISAHYSGPYQHRFGKGRSIKGNDLAAADLCDCCHRHFDEYQGITASDGAERLLQRCQRSEEFLFLCLLTVIRRQEQGLLK